MKHLPLVAITLAMATTAVATDGEFVMSRAGSRSVAAAPTTKFTGLARVETLLTPTGADRAPAGNVSFMHGARTHSHIHPLGQTLIVTAGAGRVQREGGPVESIREGGAGSIPPNVRHWHGAAPDSATQHGAMSVVARRQARHVVRGNP